jgi:hypothetical protein
MKSVIAVAVIALLLTPVNAYAACPNITGPYICCGSGYWHEYEWDASCAGTSGSVGSGTLSCFNSPSKTFTGASGTVTYSYTIGASDPINNSNKWSVGLFLDFDDSTDSQYNTITASVSVTHNGSTTSNTIKTHNGTQGDLGCNRYDYWYFTAVPGDTITVTITGTNFSANAIEAGVPFLMNSL